MNDPANKDGSASLTVKIGWGALLVIVAGTAIWWIGVVHLDGLLGIDTQCENTRHGRRGAELAEMLRCSVEAGPGGWFYIAWLAVFPFLLVTWLERRLRHAMLERRKITPRD